MSEFIRRGRLVDNECGCGKHYEPPIIKCTCSRHLTLHSSLSNKCECGRFYNGSGQLLSHPRNWGEETGERFDDNGQLIL